MPQVLWVVRQLMRGGVAYSFGHRDSCIQAHIGGKASAVPQVTVCYFVNLGKYMTLATSEPNMCIS